MVSPSTEVLQGAAVSAVALISLICFPERGYAQNVVDSSICETRGKHCPESGDASYKSKCCVESDGGTQLLTCCNPIVGFYIGISVSVVIILIITVISVTLCCCWRYHNRRKTRQLMRQLEEQRRQPQIQQVDTDNAAPPPYTPVSDKEDCSLPVYTQHDPYASPSSSTNYNLIMAGGTSNRSGEDIASRTGEAESLQISVEESELLLMNDTD